MENMEACMVQVVASRQKRHRVVNAAAKMVRRWEGRVQQMECSAVCVCECIEA